jgi:hypothetical protein
MFLDCLDNSGWHPIISSDSSEDGRPHAGKDWSSEQYDTLSTLRDGRLLKFNGNVSAVTFGHLSITRYFSEAQHCNDDRD